METHKLSEASIPRGDSKSDYKFCRKSLINLRKEILFQFVKEIQSGALRQRTRGPANCLIGRPGGILIGLSCPTRSLTPQISSPSMCGNMYFVERVHIYKWGETLLSKYDLVNCIIYRQQCLTSGLFSSLHFVPEMGACG